ncbi:MAG: tetraacyldisaccharide 4'-kinase, partial [Woeseiaceae bacterium]|nr:tetraacyldisaccharide 4'-kinase [Woeseiaceae bacterium]
MNAEKQNWVGRTWYGGSLVYWVLLPLTCLFSILSSVRRFFYRVGILTTQRVDAPVVVVGNIAVGGTGKTPITIWLVKELLRRGQRPAIISRGYRGNVGPFPWEATEDSDAAVVGDEAIMLARQCQCPVIVHPDRVAAARMAIEHGANILVADDGLQHYRLNRDVEIAVVDGTRRFGNGTLLPAGPLREPVSRLEAADIVLVQQEMEGAADEWVMRRATDPQPFNFYLRVAAVVRLDRMETRELSDFAGKTVHAIAGIGHPERFF